MVVPGRSPETYEPMPPVRRVGLRERVADVLRRDLHPPRVGPDVRVIEALTLRRLTSAGRARKSTIASPGCSAGVPKG